MFWLIWLESLYSSAVSFYEWSRSPEPTQILPKYKSEMTLELRQCYRRECGFWVRKKGYTSIDEAFRCLSEQNKPNAFSLYKCEICRLYHLGHKRALTQTKPNTLDVRHKKV